MGHFNILTTALHPASVNTPILQKCKLRLTEEKWLAQGHMALACLELEPDLIPMPILFFSVFFSK